MPPHEYETWPAKSRALAESLVQLDASVNKFGIPVAQARDEELGWDVAFVADHTVTAVKDQIKGRYGDKGLPDGVTPVVTLNPKTWARVQAERERQAATEQGREE